MSEMSRERSGMPWVDQAWSAILALWVMAVLLVGGTGFPPAPVQIFLTVSAVLIIVAAAWRLRQGFPTGMAAALALIAALAFCAVLVQLVPVPYGIWKDLPGRGVAVRALDALGQSPALLPLSLDADATARASLSLLPPLAAFLAVLTVPRQAFWYVSGAIVACAMIGFLLGIIQKGQGAASGLFFYLDPGTAKYATGTFANRNLFAAQLYASIPFLAAFGMALANRWRMKPLLISFFTLIYIGVLVAVLAAVGSRAGILLAMFSVLLTILFVFRPSATQASRMVAGKGVLAALIFMLVMAQASMVGILRLAESDPLTDVRSTIATVSFNAARDQFPIGSGYGTFVPVYQMYETSRTIVDPYINHAHNEWLEAAIEGGAPAIVLMALFVLWLFYALVQAARLPAPEPANAHIRGAGVALLLMMMHAVVDFPFRTDALLTLAGLCSGFLALSTAPVAAWHPRPASDGARKAPAAGVPPRAFRQATRTFAQARAEGHPPVAPKDS